MEEDIIKRFEFFCKEMYYWTDDDMGGHFEPVVGDQKANTMLGYLVFKEVLQNLIARNKELEKENIINKTAKEEVEELLENSIPKSKIQEKIEELNKRIEKYREYVEQGIETDVEWVDNVADRQVIRVLQELLEKGK